MNILFISHYSEKGGANNELLWLATEIQGRGHCVFVALPSHGSMEQKLTECGIPYEVFGYKRWIVTMQEKDSVVFRNMRRISISANNYETARRIARYAREQKIDIIHTNDSLTQVGTMAAELCGIPHVWHLREFLEEDYQRSIVFSERYIKTMFAKSKKIICISDAIRRKYQKFFTHNDVRIYDGLRIREYLELPDKVKLGEKLNVLFLGGTSEGKGFPQLLELAHILKSQYQLQMQITVAGDCKSKDIYLPVIQKYGLIDVLQFMGFVNHVDRLFAESDVFLMMSKLEAFGLVTVEAMLGGAIVVGNGVGGTQEIIEDGKTGFLYPENDLATAAKIINGIFCGQYHLDDIRERAFDAAIHRFDIKRTADEVLELYQKIKKEENVKK